MVGRTPQPASSCTSTCGGIKGLELQLFPSQRPKLSRRTTATYTDVVEKSCPSQLRRGPLNYSDEGSAPSLFEGSKINLSRDFHIEASNVRMISSTAKNRSVASASSAQTMRPRVLPFGDNRPQATEKLGAYYQ